ncbi:MAG: hypothetical protein K2X27_28365 [Candidatus Obscuribacterales bacterium]|nr:hypothetical protein [Candidatus Obscuribacterales bacterium]
MQNLALAIEAPMPCQEVDIVSTGVESLAVAALLSSRGRAVRFTQQGVTVPDQLLIRGGSVNYKAGRLQLGASAPEQGRRSSDLLLVCGKAGDYRKALNMVAEMLCPGQTVFIVDAPLGTAFELSCMIYKLRKRMAVNIIEMSPLFEECRFEGRALEIIGLREQVPICGRSVNETRSGLDIGRQLFTGLVPASNVLERGLSDPARIMRIALQAFHLERLAKGLAKPWALSSEQEAKLKEMEQEIQALGRLFNVHVTEAAAATHDFSDNLEREKQELEISVSETLVLLSDLAGVAYQSVPCIDMIIALASKTLGKDLRAESRKLSDLGLVGMDLREIIELVNS